MMRFIPAIGSWSLGFVVGYMAWYFIVRTTDFTAGSFASVVLVVAGGAGVAFVGRDATDPTVRWWYPIGLLVSLVVYALLRASLGGAPFIEYFPNDGGGASS